MEGKKIKGKREREEWGKKKLTRNNEGRENERKERNSVREREREEEKLGTKNEGN